MRDCCTTSVYYEPLPPDPVYRNEDDGAWAYLLVGLAAGLLLGMLLLPRPKGPDKKKLNDDLDGVITELRTQAHRFARPEAEAAVEETGKRARTVLTNHGLGRPIP